MIRGITLFICTECKKVFWAPDVEYDAMVYSVPMPCERCGSIRTMPMKLDPFHSDKLNPNKPLEKQLCYYSIYESIWKRIGRPDIDGTPDEQYRTGMMFLNGEAWSMRNSEVAFYWFMKAAKRGHAQAQYQVGAMLDRMRYRYKYDKYLEEPPFCCTSYAEGTVYQWISKAVGQGLPEAMCYLGNMYRIGNSVEKNFEKTFEWHQKAIVSGCVESEYALGCMYEQGEGVQPDLHEAVRWYKEAAKHGYVKAQLHLGRLYESTGKERDYQEAFVFYQQAAQQKPAEAWQRLASLYEAGKGMEQDFLKAWECYLNAWKAGSEKAYKEAKRLLDDGLAHPEVSALKEWYRKCIAQGHREMWYDLGKLYEEGKEGERNLEEAFQCYGIAARTAHVAEAQYALGCMYEQGEGTQPDLQKAVRWYEEAAKQGHVKAQAACRRLKE